MNVVVPLLAKIPEADRANFYAEDVTVGSFLRFHGQHKRAGQIYRVTGFYAGTGRWFAKPRHRWRDMTDVVRLVAVTGGEIRIMNLTYITYSALWHLVTEERR